VYAVRCLLYIILLSGCWPEVPHNPVVGAPPHVDEAIEICHDLYASQLYDLPPFEGELIWMEGECLEIDLNFAEDLVVDYPDCLDGIYFAEYETAYVLVRTSLANTILSHELIHYWLDVTTGSTDKPHQKDEWWSLVKPANVLIRDMEQYYEDAEEAEDG